MSLYHAIVLGFKLIVEAGVGDRRGDWGPPSIPSLFSSLTHTQQSQREDGDSEYTQLRRRFWPLPVLPLGPVRQMPISEKEREKKERSDLRVPVLVLVGARHLLLCTAHTHTRERREKEKRQIGDQTRSQAWEGTDHRSENPRRGGVGSAKREVYGSIC